MFRSLIRFLVFSAIARVVFGALRQLRILAAAVVAVPVAMAGCGAIELPTVFGSDTPRAGKVVRVADGDTITVAAPGEQTIRLLGIDTPELSSNECGARQARARTLELLYRRARDTDGDGLADAPGGRGRRVKLAFNSTGEREDRYGRSLAWVRRAGDRVTVQEILVREGLAMVYRFRGRQLDHGDRLDDAAAAARRARRGVWGALGCNGDFHSARPGVQR